MAIAIPVYSVPLNLIRTQGRSGTRGTTFLLQFALPSRFELYSQRVGHFLVAIASRR